MRKKQIAGIMLAVFLVNTLTMIFVATNGQTESSGSIDPFPQAGQFYTLAGRTIMWEIVGGQKRITHFEEMLKWSVQDVAGSVAIVNFTIVEVSFSPETDVEVRADISDLDSEIAIDRTILSRYMRTMSFGSITGYGSSNERRVDEDVGEHTWAWFPTTLSKGAEVPVSWTLDRNFLGDKLYKVVGEETIQVLGERQNCWKLHMPASTADGELAGQRVLTDTNWIDKDTGIPLKIYEKAWSSDGSYGWEMEAVVVHMNIDLGPASTKAPGPTYTLAAPESPGFPEADKFLTWYYVGNISRTDGTSYYFEGPLVRWIVDVTDDKALLYRIDLWERICEAEGVGELEDVMFNCINYTIGTTSRGYLAATGFRYHINMTSLYWEKEDLTGKPPLQRVGRETSYWAPKNLYIGAIVGWEYFACTVVDEKVVNALGEEQAVWTIYSPPTFVEVWGGNVTDTEYVDKDTGIPIGSVTKEEYINEIWWENTWLLDTNIDLGPEVELTIKLAGELDYLSGEKVKIRLTALVTDVETKMPISKADVTVKIYNPRGRLWVSAKMVETSAKGVYQWQSASTIYSLTLEKGVYLVKAKASFPGGPTASDILEFHIDPPTEDLNPSPTLIAIAISIAAGSFFLAKSINNRLRRPNQHKNTPT